MCSFLIYPLYILILINAFCSVSMAIDSVSMGVDSVSMGVDSVSMGVDSQQIVIEVRESVHVNNRKITLGEIAHIEAPELLKRQISAIDIGFAPIPGKTKIIDGRQLESKIKSNKLIFSKKLSSNRPSSNRPSSNKPSSNRPSSNKPSSNKPSSNNSASNNSHFDNITVLVPEKIYLERASQNVSSDDLKELYEKYVYEKLNGQKLNRQKSDTQKSDSQKLDTQKSDSQKLDTQKSDSQKLDTQKSNGQDFEIRDFAVRGLDIYPEGEITLSPPLSNASELKGRVTIYVNVQVDGKDYGRLSLSGWIDIFDDVLCASRSLIKGKSIESGDVHVERTNIDNLHGDYFNDDQDVIGKVLTRNVPPNKAITTNMIEDAALIHKGDTVKIIAARGNLSIVTIGSAKSEGRINDTVQVQNMTSGKIINAIVTGKESVKVFY